MLPSVPIALLAFFSLASPEDQTSRWLREWAQSGTPSWIEGEFVSTVTREVLEAPLVYKGRWTTRLFPFVSFVIEFREFSGDRLVREERLSWDSGVGEGRSFQRGTNTDVGAGVASPWAPAGSGRVELPSSHHFYAIDDRPLKSHLKRTEPVVRILEPSGSRFVAFFGKQDSKILHAYVLDRAKEQPIEEVRVYVPPEASLIPPRNQDLGWAIELPEGYSSNRLFTIWRVLESARVGRYSVPSRWSVIHCLLKSTEETVIAVSQDSIRIEPPDGTGSLLAEWPPGTSVSDVAKGVQYWIGKNQERLSGEVISESTLDKILLAAAIVPPIAAPEEKAEQQETNCAANALYLALAMQAKPEPLRAVVRALGVSGGAPETSIEAIRGLLGSRGVRCVPVKGEAECLTMGGAGLALLHAKRKPPGGSREVGHYILVDDYDPASETVRVFDPPVVPYRSKVSDVLTPWSGNAVLIGEAVDSLAARNRRLNLIGLGLLGAFALCLGLFARQTWRRRTALFFVLSVILPACSKGGARTQSAGIAVVGSPEFDFGEVKLPTTNMKHAFSLRSSLGKEVRVASIRKSCNCLSATVTPDTIPAGGQAEVMVELEGRIMAGSKASVTNHRVR